MRQMTLRRHQSVVNLGIDGQGLTADAAPKSMGGGNRVALRVSSRADKANTARKNIGVGGIDTRKLGPSHGMAPHELPARQDGFGGEHDRGLHAADIDNRGIVGKHRREPPHKSVQALHRSGQQNQGCPPCCILGAGGDGVDDPSLPCSLRGLRIRVVSNDLADESRLACGKRGRATDVADTEKREPWKLNR